MGGKDEVKDGAVLYLRISALGAPLFMLASAAQGFLRGIGDLKTPLYILQDFWHCLKLLWRDPLGQVSLAVTTLFWGAGATLRFIVLKWAGERLHFNDTQAAQLSAVTAVGIAVGSVLAARMVSLNRAVNVLPVGIFMGVVVMAMTLVRKPKTPQTTGLRWSRSAAL